MGIFLMHWCSRDPKKINTASQHWTTGNTVTAWDLGRTERRSTSRKLVLLRKWSRIHAVWKVPGSPRDHRPGSAAPARHHRLWLLGLHWELQPAPPGVPRSDTGRLCWGSSGTLGTGYRAPQALPASAWKTRLGNTGTRSLNLFVGLT